MNVLYVTILAPRMFRWFLDFGKLVNPCNTALQIETDTVTSINGIMMVIEGGWEYHLFCQTVSSTPLSTSHLNRLASNGNFS